MFPSCTSACRLLALLLLIGVMAWAAPINVAVTGIASQSSTYPTGDAFKAIDDNTNGDYAVGSVTHTQFERNAWWMVDLGSLNPISGIHIWNRTDCCSTRLSNFRVSILDAAQAEVWGQDYAAFPNPDLDITGLAAVGEYVKVQLSGADYLSLAEVQVFSDTGVPEPSTFALFGLGLLGVAAFRRRGSR